MSVIVVVIGLLAALAVQPAQALDVPATVDGLVGTVGGLLGSPATPAQVDPVQQLLSGINSVRAGVGVAPLELDLLATTVAQTWTLVMATAGEISHNPNLSNQLAGFLRVGENVGMGPSLDWIHNGLINSPAHYKNMVNPVYTRVGLGVINTGLTVWVVEDFIATTRPGGSSFASPTTKPPMAATPATAAPSTAQARPTSPKPAAAAVAPVVTPAVPAGPPRPSEWLVTVLERLSMLDRLSV